MAAIATRCLPLAVAVLLSIQCPLAVADAQIGSVSVQDASVMLGQHHAIIIDVRENAEWQQQHIPNAIHIPLAELGKRLPELAQYKDSPVITQCRSGKRSAQAANMLKSAGFNQVYNMDGGLNAWQKAGLPSQ